MHVRGQAENIYFIYFIYMYHLIWLIWSSSKADMRYKESSAWPAHAPGHEPRTLACSCMP
jgi:hypothetical protein